MFFIKLESERMSNTNLEFQNDGALVEAKRGGM